MAAAMAIERRDRLNWLTFMAVRSRSLSGQLLGRADGSRQIRSGVSGVAEDMPPNCAKFAALQQTEP